MKKKERIKNLLHSFLKDIYDFGESANKIELGSEVLDEKKIQMATIGCYDENTPEWAVKQTLDIIVLRFVLEAMKLEYFVHIPYSRQITRKLTTKSTTKAENLQEKIMPNLFLESKMNEIEDLQDTINIFYKTNIFDEMIKILNKSIEANLIKFEEDKKN